VFIPLQSDAFKFHRSNAWVLFSYLTHNLYTSVIDPVFLSGILGISTILTTLFALFCAPTVKLCELNKVFVFPK
jgi:hypothetical protein